MEKLEIKIREQIDKLKEEVLDTTNQIEKFRNECDEGDVGINTELQDKLELISEKILALQKNLSIYQEKRNSLGVDIGKTVNISNGKVTNKELVIVLPEDADSRNGFISCNSPLGSALLNKREGETINFSTPVGAQEFIINKVM